LIRLRQQPLRPILSQLPHHRFLLATLRHACLSLLHLGSVESLQVSAPCVGCLLPSKGIGETLYALRETDGSVAWTNLALAGSRSYPVVADDGVYVMSSGPDVFKLDPLTGNPLWHYVSGTSGGGGRSLVYSNGRLYVRALVNPSFGTNEIAILDATNGHLLTSFQPGAPSVPAISGGLGYTENQGSLIAFDAITGAVIWNKTMSNDPFVYAPIVVNGTVFAGTSSGKVFEYSGQTGAQVGFIDGALQMFRPDEQNVRLLPGLAAGDGLLVVPASGVLTVYSVPEPVSCLQALICLACIVLGLASPKVASASALYCPRMRTPAS
jgi:outer membrane protein assembly factor BamB